MQKADSDELVEDLKLALAQNTNSKFAIVGHTPLTYDIIAFFRTVGAENRLLGVYSEHVGEHLRGALHRSIDQLGPDSPNVVVIASDREKERLLELAAPHLRPDVSIVPNLVDHLLTVIRALRDDNLTILLVEQNARAALAIADRAYVLETGRVTLSGPAAEIQADRRVREAYLGI